MPPIMDPTPVWYGSAHPLARLLAPLGDLYCLVARLRRLAYLKGLARAQRLPVPVLVVGNLTVGGTGKTPLVAALAIWMRAQGWRPAIISRGYGGRSTQWPREVTPDADPRLVGDETVLLARRAGCPVFAGPDRVAAGRLACSSSDADLLIADDGLQHYRLARDLEIAVIDGVRGLGNGRCLPAGPLREPPVRLEQVDFVVVNGGDATTPARMELVPGPAVNLRDHAKTRPLAEFTGIPLFAIAAIGHPERFFAMLRSQGIPAVTRAYPDHHAFSPSDVADWPPGPVLMTEKDAVKCSRLAGEDHWFVPVEARCDPDFLGALTQRLEAFRHV